MSDGGKGGLLPINTSSSAEAKAGGGWRRRHPLHEAAKAASSASPPLPSSPKLHLQQRQKQGSSRRKRLLARALLLLVVATLLWYLRAVAETYRERDKGPGGRSRRTPRSTSKTSSTTTTTTKAEPGRNGRGSSSSSSSSSDRISCISWRQTHHCSPDGERDRAHDKGCEYRIRKDSGYCECTGGLTAKRVSCGRHGGFTCDDECEILNEQPELARPFPANVSCPSPSSSFSSSSSAAAAAAVIGPNTSPARAARAEEASAKARETAIADGWWHLSGSGGGEEGQRSEKGEEGNKLGGGGGENGAADESGVVVAADTAAGREADASAAALWSSLSAAFAVAKEAAAAEGRRLDGGGRRRRRRKNRGGRRWGGATSDDGGEETELEFFEEEENVLLIPERRTDGRDWSIDGARLPPRVVKAALAGQRAFLRALPAYPRGRGGGAAEKDDNNKTAAAAPQILPFSGRGVVFLGGGPTYLVPTLVALRALRLAGCSLPAEVWFPRAEAPTRGLEGLLAGLGAVARLLPPGAARTTEGALGAKAAGGAIASAAAAAAEGKGKKQKRGEKDEEAEEEEEEPASDDASADAPLGPSLGPAGGDGDLSGFTMKAAALLLSRFEEVLLLDSDNVAALDPESLFESREFVESGAVLWPDYWESTAARDAAAALGLDEGDEEEEKEKSKNLLSRGSHESGQMLFDKARAWPALALAAYFNSAPGFYYEILSCFMGKGDKETFAAALAATRTPFHRIRTPVGSVGLRAVPERRCWLGQRWCSAGRYAGNTMTQHDTHGRVMFLHTNLSPKWNLRIPASSRDLRRRWEVLQPGGRPFREAIEFDSNSLLSSSSDAASAASVDLEGEVFDFLAALSCDAALRGYAGVMAARANALREREEAEARREDEALERLLEAEEEAEAETSVSSSKEEQEKPAWRARAERRREERLEEEARRERELARRRKAALAARERARRRRHSKRRSGGSEEEGQEQEDEETDDDEPSSSLLLLDAEKEPKKEPPQRVSPADLLPRGLPASSFHPLNPGVDFARAFRWGLRGTFEEFTPLGPFDWLLHFVNGGVRPAGRRVRRGLAFLARGGGGYFRPF